MQGDPLARASLSELAHYHEAAAAWNGLEARVKPDVSPEVWAIVEQLLEARTLVLEATQDLFIAELIRHFPGLAPALTRVWIHVGGAFFETVGSCCTPPDNI